MKAFFAKGNDDVEIRPAATAVVIRSAAHGFEVLLLCRSKKSTFADSVWVFPGGGVEPQDFDLVPAQIESAADAQAKSELPNGNALELEQATRYAAVRETAEECGLSLSVDGLVPYSHWTTPVGPPRRYSTWFYFYLLEDSDAEVVVDNEEIVDFQWLTPSDALKKQSQGDLTLLPPTFVTLEALSNFTDAQLAMDQLKTTEFITILPKATKQGDTTIMLYPGDAGYETGDANVEGLRHRFLMSKDKWLYEKHED